MNWSDINFRPPEQLLRQFGVLCLVISLVLAGLRTLQAGWGLLSTSLVVSGAILGIVGIFAPRALGPLFVALTVVTFPIGWLVSRLVLAAVFYLLVTPIGWALRITGRDALERRSPPQRSYWKSTKTSRSSESYLHQF
jgi:hypothetical protein